MHLSPACTNTTCPSPHFAFQKSSWEDAQGVVGRGVTVKVSCHPPPKVRGTSKTIASKHRPASQKDIISKCNAYLPGWASTCAQTLPQERHLPPAQPALSCPYEIPIQTCNCSLIASLCAAHSWARGRGLGLSYPHIIHELLHLSGLRKEQHSTLQTPAGPLSLPQVFSDIWGHRAH